MSEHREKAIQDSLLLYGGDPHGEQFEDWLDQRELVHELADALEECNRVRDIKCSCSTCHRNRLLLEKVYGPAKTEGRAL